MCSGGSLTTPTAPAAELLLARSARASSEKSWIWTGRRGFGGGLNPGSPDATTTFVFNSVDSVFSSGKEITRLPRNGTLTLVATGARLRFHVVLQLVIDVNGDATVNVERVTCD